MLAARITLALTLALLLAACGGDAETVPNGPVLLAEMRAETQPYDWVGESFDGLALTYARPYNGRFGTLMYGACELPTGLFAEGGCSPPLQVQNVLCTDGTATVALFSDGGGRAARVAKALRPLNAAARRAWQPRVTLTAAFSAKPPADRSHEVVGAEQRHAPVFGNDA